MKIAFPTEDGENISMHFGKAPYYTVIDISGGAQAREKRPKAHHGQSHDHGAGHTHDDMFASISDCQVLVVGGMGTPAYQAAVARGLQVIPVSLTDITSALQAYLDGKLQPEEKRIH